MVDCDCDGLLLVLEMIRAVGLCLGLVVSAVVCSLVPSLTKINCSAVLAVVSSYWLLKTGYGVGGDFRTENRSDMIIDNVSVVVSNTLDI